MGLTVAINLIVSPEWDTKQFALVREWATSVPEIVNLLPTRLPLREFYSELVRTQAVLNRKHLGLAALGKTAGIVGRHLLHGQTNFARMLWKFNSVYNVDRQHGEHQRPVRYELPVPDYHLVPQSGWRELYVHQRSGR